MKQSTFIRVLRQYAQHAKRLGRDYSTVVDELAQGQFTLLEEEMEDSPARDERVKKLESLIDREYPRTLRLLPYPKKEEKVRGAKTAKDYQNAMSIE